MNAIAHLHRESRGNHFRARSLRSADPALIDPFLGIDHARISAPTFPAHPHAGFSAVSYVFADSETGIANRDSLGNRNLILPGGLHWMAAGRGVVHEEVPVEIGKAAHMLQIFINLPREAQSAEPFTMNLPPQDVPEVHLSGARIRNPLGSFGEKASPISPPTDVSLFDISLEEGVSLTLPVGAGQNAFVMPIDGNAVVDGHHLGGNDLTALLSPAKLEASEIGILAGESGFRAVLFAGRPLRLPVYWRGPMAMASTAALDAATAAYQRGDFGTI
ncbi:hypothetical protein SAMN04487965_0268 [Microbulbifer donghaiensis]|uniref:Pirin n=1 Tax=Microbulbifer donghaiensis TaxID=494016 RepID=A0A1M4UWK8_9GAMM|nr:pirin family protein [Microbulbifer donghaiensis]SHE61116.1 hypothetical protein SAMN04487965_0268 [Microbulbifer donghaiensis]